MKTIAIDRQKSAGKCDRFSALFDLLRMNRIKRNFEMTSIIVVH